MHLLHKLTPPPESGGSTVIRHVNISPKYMHFPAKRNDKDCIAPMSMLDSFRCQVTLGFTFGLSEHLGNI